MSRDNALLQLKNIYFAYHENEWVLRDLSVDIYKGERIVVLGSNGAGKSTLFLTMNGVRIPQMGEILFHGKKIGNKNKDLMALRKNIGVVFQDADNQMIAGTVLGEVSFGPMNMGFSKEEVAKRTQHALEDMGLCAYKNRAPHYLSGGEKKSVSIADILAMETEVILFDEPTAFLDPENTAMLESLLEKLSKREITLLVSIHDVDFAYRFADRILVFHEGKMVADGAPLSIFRNEELLKTAHLKKPMLMEVWETLLEKKVVQDNVIPPKNLEEFRKYIL